MKTLQSIVVIICLAVPFVSHAQGKPEIPSLSPAPKLIAVVNRANWCGVCRANGPRFGTVLMPYAAQGVTIYINDLTNSTTKATSEAALQQAHVYEAVTTVPRKGMGKMLRACGLLRDKKQLSGASGIVTFVDPKTHKQLGQMSIASSDEAIKTTIDNLLKHAL